MCQKRMRKTQKQNYQSLYGYINKINESWNFNKLCCFSDKSTIRYQFYDLFSADLLIFYHKRNSMKLRVALFWIIELPSIGKTITQHGKRSKKFGCGTWTAIIITNLECKALKNSRMWSIQTVEKDVISSKKKHSFYLYKTHWNFSLTFKT